MAATTIKTNTVYDSYFWVKWESGGQDVSANKTAINWSCGVKPGHKFYSNAVKMSAVTINGVQVYAGGTYSNITDYKERTFASGTLDVSHNADGSKTLTVSAFSGKVWKEDSGGYLTATAEAKSFQLPTIPRATVPYMGTATIGEEVHISLPRASSGFTHTLRYVFGGAAETIDTGVADGYDWLVPESLAAQIPNDPSGTGTLTCETYSGSTIIGTKSVPFTASVPGSMKPAITPGWATVTYDNSGTKASGIAAWVQGYSKAKAVFDSSKIACKQGASIAKYAVTYLGKTVEESPYRTETISTTSATVRCTVTDSRGLSAYEDFEIAIHPYAPPALTGAMLYRADGDGAASDSGTHIAGRATANYSSIGGENAAAIRGYWKAVGGSYGSGEALSSGVTGIISGSAVISADRSYVAKLVITDSLGNTAEFEDSIPTERVAFHLKEGGNGAAFGKVAETEYVLELAEDWELKVKGKRLLDLIYPVGSIYMSVNSASPDTLFGGTWVRLEDVFLLAAGAKHAAGSTGGEESHTLTDSEMPSHNGHLSAGIAGGVPMGKGNYEGYLNSNVMNAYPGGNYRGWNVYAGNEMHPASEATGGDQPHNNMPPYLATYTWHRIA